MSIRAIKIGYEDFGFDFAPSGWCLSGVSGDLIPSKSVSFSGSAVTSVSDNSRSISFTLAPVEQLPPINYRQICNMIQAMKELIVYDTGTYLKISQDAATGAVTTKNVMLGAISCPCIVTACTYNYSDANPRITFTVGLTRNYFKQHNTQPTNLVTVALSYGNRKTMSDSLPSLIGEFYEYSWRREIVVLGNTSYYTKMRFMDGDAAIVNLQSIPSGNLRIYRAGNFEVFTQQKSYTGFMYNNLLDPVCDLEGINDMFSLSLPSVSSNTYIRNQFQAIDTVSITPVRYIL